MKGSGTTALYVGKSFLSRNYGSPHDYAEASHLYELLSEATKILLRKAAISSPQVLSEFLGQCNRGEHVLLKSYGSFSKSPLCKLCFLFNFLKIFEAEAIQRNGLDYYQLSRLLCSDFPREFIQKAAGLLVPHQDAAAQMYKPLPARRFAQAVYLFMIYTEYLQVLAGNFQQEEELDFLQLLRVIREEDQRNIKEFTKPPFSVLAQSLLTLMKSKGLLAEQQAAVVFITEENIEDFVRDATTNHPEQAVSLQELLQQVLQSQEYCQLVEDNLGMFENSGQWAGEVHKILSTREQETPLNVKKKGSKK